VFKNSTICKYGEAALDTQLLVVTADLCKEKASQLFVEGNAFDPSAFTVHLLNFMGLKRHGLEDEEKIPAPTQDAWHRVAKTPGIGWPRWHSAV